jgi:pilus assembly protein CpaF
MNNPQQTSSQQPVVDPNKLKSYLINYISHALESKSLTSAERTKVVRDLLVQAYESTKLQLSNSLRDDIFKVVMDELIGFGPIQQLLDDPQVTEVMVNGAKNVYVEKNGKLEKTTIVFDDDIQVLRVIDRIILPLGRRIDSDSPTVDARLPDGSRVNAIIPPVAIDGPSITIRKFSKEHLTFDQLIELGTITRNMADFIRACVVAKLNIIISGGTGSGKTTLLNVLSSFIPENERIVTIEDAAELRLQQEHIVRCETKAPNSEGKNAVTIRDLVRNALRMRPDRIVVGEVRGGEALDMLQAMNTGHDGSLTTLHANTPRDTISRLETMCLMAGMDLPIKVLREQIASAIDLVIQQARLRDGTRKIVSITEVSGMEGDTVVMTEIFRYEQTGIDQQGNVLGQLKPTGIRPLFSPRLEVAGFKLGPEVFGANLADMLGRNR